jgi:hypothetical protein
VSWDTVINPGSTAWKVVERDKPSPDLDSSACHGLPDVTDWNNVTDPAGTASRSGVINKVDKYGRPVIDIVWKLEAEFGSRYNGGGAFIRTCLIAVPTCFVGFGWDVQLAARVEDPQVKGTSTAPIALLRIHVEGTVTSPYSNETKHWLTAVRGDGAMQF